MILTCPECDTKYVVKDGAIPVGGRKVRCASCKHSWHQDPEMPEEEPTIQPVPTPPFGDAEAGLESPAYGEAAEERSDWREVPADVPTFAAPAEEPPSSFVGVEVEAFTGPSAEPMSDAPYAPSGDADWETVEPAPAWGERVPTDDDGAEEVGTAVTAPAPSSSDEFEPFYPASEEDAPRTRRWPWVLLIILLIGAAAAAFWYLAPSDMKQQVGLAKASSPLDVMSISNSRQELASGNDLLTVSGRIINPTTTNQPVPPLRAELLDKTKTKVIHSWMISPPVATLEPSESRTFHSAEMDVPDGGEYVRVRLSTGG